MSLVFSELHESYPRSGSIVDAIEEFSELVTKTPEEPSRWFSEDMGVFRNKLTSRDETLFTEDFRKIRIFHGVNMRRLWKNASDETKNKLWDHLKALYTMSSTLNIFTGKQMNAVESLVDNMKNVLFKDNQGRNLVKSMAKSFGMELDDAAIEEVRKKDMKSLMKESLEKARIERENLCKPLHENPKEAKEPREYENESSRSFPTE